MDMSRFKHIDYPAAGHGALVSIGVQQGGPKRSLPLALYDGPKSMISLIFDVLWKEKTGVIDELTLMLKPGKRSL